MRDSTRTLTEVQAYGYSQGLVVGAVMEILVRLLPATILLILKIQVVPGLLVLLWGGLVVSTIYAYLYRDWTFRSRLRRHGYDRITLGGAKAIRGLWECTESLQRPPLIPAHDAFLIPGIPPDADGILTVMRMLRDHRAETRGRR